MRKTFFTTSLLALPFVSSAQVANNVRDLASRFSDIFQNIIVILIGAAVVVFLWSLFRYITEANNEAKREEAKHYMIYGVSAIFIMISVWGLVGILTATTGIQPFIGLPNAK